MSGEDVSRTRDARKLWLLPLVLAVLGAVIGALAGSAAPHRANAALVIDAPNGDGDAVDRIVQSTLERLRSPSIIDAAAKALKVDAADLGAQTDFSASSRSVTLNVDVSDSDPGQAVRKVNAVAKAAADSAATQEDQNLAQLESAFTKLIGQRPLASRAAEAARIQRLGDGLATAQAESVTSGGSLSVLREADARAVSRPSVPAMMLVGLLGGLALGLAALVALGGTARRTPVRDDYSTASRRADVGSGDFD